ncbi:hypothetical protein C8R48DRAFT_674364 [Suillus tomentosus]|nr:hypothetical protein C8R48DRAFT_674364 [Suillus tomentosus]
MTLVIYSPHPIHDQTTSKITSAVSSALCGISYKQSLLMINVIPGRILSEEIFTIPDLQITLTPTTKSPSATQVLWYMETTFTQTKHMVLGKIEEVIASHHEVACVLFILISEHSKYKAPADDSTTYGEVLADKAVRPYTFFAPEREPDKLFGPVHTMDHTWINVSKIEYFVWIKPDDRPIDIKSPHTAYGTIFPDLNMDQINDTVGKQLLLDTTQMKNYRYLMTSSYSEVESGDIYDRTGHREDKSIAVYRTAHFRYCDWYHRQFTGTKCRHATSGAGRHDTNSERPSTRRVIMSGADEERPSTSASGSSSGSTSTSTSGSTSASTLGTFVDDGGVGAATTSTAVLLQYHNATITESEFRFVPFAMAKHKKVISDVEDEVRHSKRENHGQGGHLGQLKKLQLVNIMAPDTTKPKPRPRPVLKKLRTPMRLKLQGSKNQASMSEHLQESLSSPEEDIFRSQLCGPGSWFSFVPPDVFAEADNMEDKDSSEDSEKDKDATDDDNDDLDNGKDDLDDDKHGTDANDSNDDDIPSPPRSTNNSRMKTKKHAGPISSSQSTNDDATLPPPHMKKQDRAIVPPPCMKKNMPPSQPHPVSPMDSNLPSPPKRCQATNNPDDIGVNNGYWDIYKLQDEKAAQPIAASKFSILPSDIDDDNEFEDYVSQRVMELLNGGYFLQNGVNEQGRTNNLAHDALGELCSTIFYKGNNALAKVFPNVFAEAIPKGAIALAATALAAAINKYKTGVYWPTKFAANLYQPIYENVIELYSQCTLTVTTQINVKQFTRSGPALQVILAGTMIGVSN